MKAALALLFVLTASTCFAQFDERPQTRLEYLGTNAPWLRAKPQSLTGFRDQERMKKRWSISPPKEYHKAAVRVINGGGAGAGSGVMVTHEGTGVVVLTNHHVMAKGWTGNGFTDECYATATVVGSGGTQTFRLLKADKNIDVAVLYSDNATTTHSVPVASEMPPADAVLEYVGFGGPSSGSRAFTAKRVSSREPISMDAGTVSGDSGGPILYQGTLVGINYGAPASSGNVGTHEGWNVTYPMSSHATPETLTQILRGCGIRCVPCQPRPMPAPSQPSEPTAPPTSVDDVVEALKQDTQFIALVKGQDGQDGKDGRDGKDGKDATGITKVRVSDSGNLVVTYMNGREEVVGNVKPPAAPQISYFDIVPKQEK